MQILRADAANPPFLALFQLPISIFINRVQLRLSASDRGKKGSVATTRA